MNRSILITIIFAVQLFAVQAYWDLGIGITEFSEPNYIHEISLSTYHRIEGVKKYYDMDYNSALYHFEEAGPAERLSVFYQYVDCYYLLGQYDKALSIIESNEQYFVNDNIIYLKSKIYLQLNLISESLNCLTYLKEHFPNSDYNNIVNFNIEKLNLRNHE